MLTLQILNNEAVLNAFFISSNKSFVSGEDVKILMRIYNPNLNIRYIPISGASISVELLKSDNTVLTKIASFPFPDDRSIIQLDITALESVDIISQNLIVKIAEGLTTTYAILQGGLQRIKLTSGC